MFPTLFPYGIRGFEDPERETPLSFEHQAQYYLNLSDHTFRYHHSYLFIKSNFNLITCELTQVLPAVLETLAGKLECEHKVSQLTPQEKDALALLQQVNTISAHIPGLHVSKIYVCNEIPAHSPVFQVMYGDHSVDLSQHFPKLIFFEFMWHACFQHLLGWDFRAEHSSEKGGIFGWMDAFYGSSEYTE
ncbi:hypothetical protein BDR05DRAFT_973571 [Suillus weaverae]|nr:hypothetical protein BDR05DRAFT_973571 [Suillus weaverae]